MSKKSDTSLDKVSAWNSNRNYVPAEHGLPVREESIVQLARGDLLSSSGVISSSNSAIMSVSIAVRSVGVTVLDPMFIAFALPITWQGEYIINGKTANPSRLYMAGESESFYIQGNKRQTTGVTLRRDLFIETVAALKGIGPEDVVTTLSEIDLTPGANISLRYLFTNIAALDLDKLSCREFDDRLFSAILDAFVSSTPHTEAVSNHFRSSTNIVRKAEEYFMSTEGQPISLADLCLAAGVSKSTLYNAFHATCGTPPLEYFHKRRLMKSRMRLINSPPERGLIKRTALDYGLTELGRFSVEYRKLFGESPSATLNRMSN